jgi:hypothetical protein
MGAPEGCLILFYLPTDGDKLVTRMHGSNTSQHTTCPPFLALLLLPIELCFYGERSYLL